ncbi:hypothetical protein P7D22_13505 [Lichenihabitans sp. Uapishka_5]|uniref:hypothetical protein n=1 Tax=Lichenihabitans sp. Uapishka_5 TaxID=3037302 RepID=UPI0029E80A58|nr:hypothetical protein [Lichenihabitans sp. Uapishka_5]MDX7952192.1 hypothetical protein [Lichenihabitans sp. Uapishka_5]
MSRAGRWVSLAFGLVAASGSLAAPLPPVPDVRFAGPPTLMFDPAHDGCDGNDVPDAPARVFRRADGVLVMFGLHYTNHPLIGPKLDGLKIECRSALLAHGNPDPAAYDDRSWIAATWTRDGRAVDALVHHEFQANEHPGRCRFPGYMQCWFNTVLGVHSADGGRSFIKGDAPVVASAPFRQEVGQGRHRGFFNPSNIVSDGLFFYALASTTGWDGQEGGVCLFRTDRPDVPGSWRAFDGTGFTARFGDPYRGAASRDARCSTIAPFPAPVGSLVRQRGSGVWFAVFQASADANRFPVGGFYVATSRDLLHWSEPRLLLAGATNYDDPCRAGGRLLAYPALIDPDARGRNFDDVGPRATLLFASLRVDGCTITSDRTLLGRPVDLAIQR